MVQSIPAGSFATAGNVGWQSMASPSAIEKVGENAALAIGAVPIVQAGMVGGAAAAAPVAAGFAAAYYGAQLGGEIATAVHADDGVAGLISLFPDQAMLAQPGPEPATIGHAIYHSNTFWGKVAGILGGLATGIVVGLVVAAEVAAVIGTGGLAGPALIAANIAIAGAAGAAGGAAAGFVGTAIAGGGAKSGHRSGGIIKGSPNVTFERQPVARVGDLADCKKCGLVKLAEGSATVTVNGKRLVRKGHLTECHAVVQEHCVSIVADQRTVQELPIRDEMTTGEAVAVALLNVGAAVAGNKIGNRAKSEEPTAKPNEKPTNKANEPEQARSPKEESTNQEKANQPEEPKPADEKANDNVAKDGEPVTVATGEYTTTRIDFAWHGLLPLVLERTYLGSRLGAGLTGRRWMCNWSQRLWFSSGGSRVILENASGDFIGFAVNPGEPFDAFPAIERYYHLTGTHDAASVFDRRSQTFLHFAPTPGRPRLGRLVGISDRNGNRIQFDYRGTRLARVIAADGMAFGVGLDKAGRLETLTRESGGQVLVRYAYNGKGWLSDVESLSHGEIHYAYTPQGRLSCWKDSGPTEFKLYYDEYDRVRKTAASDNLYHDRFVYFPEEGKTEYYDGTGARKTTWNNMDRLPVRIENALGESSTFEWDERRNKIAATDALGRTTRFTYNAHNQLISSTDWAGRVLTFAYDDHGLPVKVVFPDGRSLTRAYDERGNLTEAVAPDGARALFTYDERGCLTSATNALGAVTRYAYDRRGRLIAVTDPAGAETRLERDQLGRLIRLIDASGQVTRYDYQRSDTNRREKLSRITHADGGVERFTYDAEGLLAKHYRPSGQDTVREYGSFDLLRSMTDAAGGRTRFGYDGAARLTTVMNAIHQSWRYTYDGAGRIVAEKDFAGRETHYAYDAVGRIIGRKRPDGEEQSFAWDERDRLVAITTPHQAIRYSYDDHDRLIRAVTERKGETETELILIYDARGRVIREIQDGAEVDYRYDEAGRIVGRASGSGEAHYGFDPRGFLSELTSNGHGLRFGRNLLGQETKREGDAGFRIEQSYDPCRRLAEQRVGVTLDGWIGQASVDAFTRRYEWDKSGRLKGIGDPTRGETRYTYDYRDQVLRVERPQSKGGWNAGEYRYDLLMNLERSDLGAHAYDQAREVTQAGPVTYQRDELGRVTLRTVTRNGFRPQTWHYEWDGFDRLISVRTPDGSLWRYTYDAFGRRVRKECVTVGHESTTHFLWQGARLAEEWTGSQTTRWHYEPGTFRPVAKEVARGMAMAGSSRFYPVVADHLGTVQEVFDERGVCQWRAEQSLWGRTKGQWRDRDAEALGEAGCNLRFQGQYEDDESGLFYNLYRYYDPDAGVYISSDPIGLAGGLRPQGYVHSPTGWVDPWGLMPLSNPTSLGHHMVPWQAATALGIEPFNSRTGVPAMYWNDTQWSGNEHSAMHGYNDIASDTAPLVKPDQIKAANLSSEQWMNTLEKHYSNPEIENIRGDLHLISDEGTKGALLAENVSPAEAWKETQKWAENKKNGCG